VALPIQRWAAKNFAAADSEIGSQKLHRCRFKNQQPKTVSLPIKKSAARTAPLLTHKSAARTMPLMTYKSAAKLCNCRFRNR